MKISILGIGKTGQGMASLLCSKGHAVTMWDRSTEKVEAVLRNGIVCKGQVNGHFYPSVTSSIGEALIADLVLVMTLAEGHSEIAVRMAGKLSSNQTILILNGNWGAAEMYAYLGEEIREKGVIIAETGGMTILCDSNSTGECTLKEIKSEMNLATIPSHYAASLIESLEDIMPGMKAAQNVLETSINNSNPILHTPIALFNITRIENAETFTFYDTGATRRVLDFVELADAERIAIASELGVEGVSCLDIINSFWKRSHPTLYDAIKENNEYMSGTGPKSLSHRYIQEDISYGIVPLVKLANMYSLDIPYLSGLLNMYCMYMGIDFLELGPDFAKIEFQALR